MRQGVPQIFIKAFLVRLRFKRKFHVIIARRTDREQLCVEFLDHNVVIQVGGDENFQRNQKVQWALSAIILSRCTTLAEGLNHVTVLFPKIFENSPVLCPLYDFGITGGFPQDMGTNSEHIVPAIEDSLYLRVLEPQLVAIAL